MLAGATPSAQAAAHADEMLRQARAGSNGTEESGVRR
jgi:hypothetical protein